MLLYGWDIPVMTFIHICTCSSCCTPVLVLCPRPGPVLHVYVHIRTVRSSWIQVRCQSCRVDCVRQSDLYVTVFLHQSSRDRSTRAYWLHPVLSGRIALGDSDSCASLDDEQTVYNWLSHDYIIVAFNISHIGILLIILTSCLMANYILIMFWRNYTCFYGEGLVLLKTKVLL